MKKVLGIDIGGTNIRAAIVNYNGKIEKRKKIKSNARNGVEKLIENLGAIAVCMAPVREVAGVVVAIRADKTVEGGRVVRINMADLWR